ncbi:24946_t:CDS:1, partial [Gigaspora margarita]
MSSFDSKTEMHAGIDLYQKYELNNAYLKFKNIIEKTPINNNFYNIALYYFSKCILKLRKKEEISKVYENIEHLENFCKQ